MTLDQLVSQEQKTIDRPPVTAEVVRVDQTGVWVTPVGGDTRVPIGPCKGALAVDVGEPVLLVWTLGQPWIQADLDTTSFETPAGAQAKVETHRVDTTNVHGIADTSLLETKAGAQTKADAAKAAAVAQILGGMPPALLDTILEIANRIEDDEDVVTALTGVIATKETPAGAQAKVDAHQADDDRWHGNTGARRVVDAGDLVDLPDLVVCVRRSGDVVTVWTREDTAAAFTGSVDVYTLPAQFRPDPDLVATKVYDPDAEDLVAGASLVVLHDGTVRLNAVAGARHLGAVTATVDAAWPAAYPGTED